MVTALCETKPDTIVRWRLIGSDIWSTSGPVQFVARPLLWTAAACRADQRSLFRTKDYVKRQQKYDTRTDVHQKWCLCSCIFPLSFTHVHDVQFPTWRKYIKQNKKMTAPASSQLQHEEQMVAVGARSSVMSTKQSLLLPSSHKKKAHPSPLRPVVQLLYKLTSSCATNCFSLSRYCP